MVATVDYDTLDRAKLAFIEASRRTLGFASQYGIVLDPALGASANIFSLNLKPWFKVADENAEANKMDIPAALHLSLVPEGLGTADDARPDDLTSDELEKFWYNIGVKTVSVLTNDAASAGLQTIAVGLYLPSSTPELVFTTEFQRGFLNGFVEGCQEVGCVYLSGETPQLKNKIYPGKLDIAGALCAIAPAGQPTIDSKALKAGDIIVLIESSGPHENGFTTLRALAEKLPKGYRTDIGNGQQFWEAINAPSKLYTEFVQRILQAGIKPTNLENITGHGWQKIMRSGAPLTYHLEHLLPVPPVFEFVQKQLGISSIEMMKIFNYGAGFAVFVQLPDGAQRVVALAISSGLNAIVAGRVEPASERSIVIEPWRAQLGE